MSTVAEDEAGNAGNAGKPPEFKELLSGCLVLSIKKVGPQRVATQTSLRKLAESEEVPTAELAKHELWRMVSTCVSSMTMEEFKEFQKGKILVLPDAYADASR